MLNSASQRRRGLGGGWVRRLRTGDNLFCCLRNSRPTYIGICRKPQIICWGSTAEGAKGVGLRGHQGARARAVVAQRIETLPLETRRQNTHTTTHHHQQQALQHFCCKRCFTSPATLPLQAQSVTARTLGQRQPHFLTQQPTCGRMHSWQGGGGDFDDDDSSNNNHKDDNSERGQLRSRQQRGQR